MRKFGFLIVAILLAGVIAGGVSASNNYKEVQENEYWISWDGSANVTLKTIFYSPEEMVNQTKENILKMGIENVTEALIRQQQQAFSQLGLTLENASAEILGYNTTGPIVMVVNGTLSNIAKYYSYDDSWEVSLDVLRVADLSKVDPTAFNSSMHLESYFTIHLPEGANVKNVTKGFKAESSGSYIQLDVNVNGTTITAHSVVYFKEGVTKDSLKVLYSKLKPLVIGYTGKTGVENYTTWEMKSYNNVTVDGNEVTLDTTEEYLKPESYLNYIKFQFAYQGLQRAEQSIYQEDVQRFQSKGIQVLSGNVSILNVDSPGPLVMKYHWVLQGFVNKVNNTYVYVYDPSLQLGNLSFSQRLNAAINETKVTRIRLPKGYEFTELPRSINIKTDAGSVVMKVTKLNDREILIESRVYLRYGIPPSAYQELMSQVPSNVEFKYTSNGESGNGICGPAAIAFLAVLPLFLRKR